MLNARNVAWASVKCRRCCLSYRDQLTDSFAQSKLDGYSD